MDLAKVSGLCHSWLLGSSSPSFPWLNIPILIGFLARTLSVSVGCAFGETHSSFPQVCPLTSFRSSFRIRRCTSLRAAICSGLRCQWKQTRARGEVRSFASSFLPEQISDVSFLPPWNVQIGGALHCFPLVCGRPIHFWLDGKRESHSEC